MESSNRGQIFSKTTIKYYMILSTFWYYMYITHTVRTWHRLGWWCRWFSRREVSDMSLIGGGDGCWVRDLQLKHCRFSKLDTITIVQYDLITERAKWVFKMGIYLEGDFKSTNYAPA